MLLPDNIHPELSIYYNGSIVLTELKSKSSQQILELYQHVKDRNNIKYVIMGLVDEVKNFK